MKTWMKAALAGAIVIAAGAGALRYLRGPSGATATFGGSIEATAVPELPSSKASSWVNGAPTPLASLRGAPVLLEIWSPS